MADSHHLPRGVIEINGAPDAENIKVNYNRLLDSQYEITNPDERKIWDFVKGFRRQNNESPSADYLYDHHERMSDLTVCDKVQVLRYVQEVYMRSSYATILESLVEKQGESKVRKILKRTDEILDKGVTEIVRGKKVTLRGRKDAEEYRAREMAKLETEYAQPVADQPSPIVTDLQAPTPFPLTVFPSRIAEYVRAVADTYEVPTDMVAFSALQVMAMACQRKVNVRILQDWKQPCILWTLVVAPSGQKKTPVYDVLMRPVWRWTSAQYEAHEAETKRIEAAIKAEKARGKDAQSEVAELQTELDELPPAKEVAYQDITPAMLTRELKRQERKVIANGKPAKVASFCLSDHDRNRLTDFKGRFNAAENEMSILHNGYDAGVIKYHRVGEGGNAQRIHVESGRIGLFCLSHPSSWDAIVDLKNNYRDGAIGRLTVYMHPPLKPISEEDAKRIPPPLDPLLQDEWDALITAMLTDPESEATEPEFGEVTLPEYAPSMIEIDCEGQRWIREVQRRRRLAVNSDNVLHPYLTWIDKWPSKMARMYGVLTYARQVVGEAPPEDVHMDHLSLCVMLQAVHALGTTAAAPSAATELQEAQRLADRLLRTAQETGRWITTVRDVVRGSKLTASKAKKLLQMLDDSGHVTLVDLDRNRVEVRITRPKLALVAAE